MPFGNSYPVIELDSRHVNDVEVQPVVLSQGDSNGRIIKYALWDGQDAMNGTGLTARFCIDQDSGLYTAMTAVAGASTATFQAAVPMGGVEAGWHVGCIRVTDSGGRVINTRTFKVYVEKAVIGGSAEQITAYADIIAGAESATDAATDAATLANNAAASAIAASGNRLGGTLDGTGTPDTADDAWTGPILGAAVDGLSVQDGTPTPSAPVDIKSVASAGAVVAGRNLFPFTSFTGSSSVSGISYTWADGKLTMSGTATARADVGPREGQWALPVGTYRLSGPSGVTGAYLTIRIHRADGTNSYIQDGGTGATFQILDPEDRINRVYVAVSSGVTVNLTVSPMISYGSAAQTYEPYAGTTTSLLPSTAAPLRSLPDGTHDELSVARDGTVTVTRHTGEYTISAIGAISGTSTKYAKPSFVEGNPPNWSSSTHEDVNTLGKRIGYCERCGTSTYNTYIARTWNNTFIYGPSSVTSFDDLIGAKCILKIPAVTETYPAITMPTVPSRNLTAWVDATDGDGAAMAAPWSMEYERDISYVIEQLEQAIADL